MYWEVRTRRYQSQTDDAVVKSITHSDDKQQQLRRDANVTRLWERHSSCVRGPIHALAPNPRPGASAVPPHTPSSHTSTDSAFSPSQTHKRKRLNMRKHLRAASHGPLLDRAQMSARMEKRLPRS